MLSVPYYHGADVGPKCMCEGLAEPKQQHIPVWIWIQNKGPENPGGYLEKQVYFEGTLGES